MRRALVYARDFDALIVHHTEDPDLVGEGVMNEGEFAARLGLTGIPAASEAVMLERDMRLVELTGGRYHAASDHLPGLARDPAPRDGQRPARQRLGLDQSSDAERKRHRSLPDLPEAVAAAAHGRRPQGAGRRRRIRADRRRDVRSQSAGCRSEAASLCRSRGRCHRARDHARRLACASFITARSNSLPLIRAMSTRPAELLGLNAGTLKAGAPADVIVIDTETPWVRRGRRAEIEVQEHTLRRGELTGRVIRTIVAGRTAYEHI